MPARQGRALAALAFMTFCGPAFAAAPGPNTAPRPSRPGAAQIQDRQDIRDARLEGRLAYLKSALRITATQTGAWDAYADAVRADMRERLDERFAPPPPPPPGPRARSSAVDALTERQERLTAKSAQLDRVLGALRPLYAVLSDDQKRTADRVLVPDFDPRAEMARRFAPPYPGDGRFGGRFFYR